MSKSMSYRENRSKTPVLDLGELSMNASVKTPNTPSRGNNINGNVSFNRSRGGLRRRDLTPSRNTNFNAIGGGDRYIPCRSAAQFEYANHCLVHHNSQGESSLNLSNSAPVSPGKREEKLYMMKLMRAKSVGDVDLGEDRILIYKRGQAPAAPFGHIGQQKVLYSTTNALPVSMARKGLRHIPTAPERILDAPNYMDDYYLNVIDWGHHNYVAVALTYSLYIWNAATGEIETLFELSPDRGIYISSVKWAREGPFIAVGLSDGRVKIFDPTKANALLRTMQTQVTRVSSLSWRKHVLSTGTRSGRICNHDVRIADHHIGNFESHTQEVCGLVWSQGGRYLASGGGDNLVNIWSPEMLSSTRSDPVYTFNDHLASVKAIAFDPNQENHLATGGGTNDRSIKFWNLSSGTLCSSKETDSQVNAIVYSRHYKEIITGHGYPSLDLKVWRYPSLTCIQTLTGHTERVMNICRSPCGQYVLSASSDETLRLWHCFKADKSDKGKECVKRTALQQSLR